MMNQCGLLDLPKFTLISGVGDYSENKACVMSAAVACYRMSRGEPIGAATDELECCCPVIGQFLILINDSSLFRDDAHRTEVLMPFVSRLAGTRNDGLTMKRVFMLADWSVRTIAADAMDRATFDGHSEQAAKLRAVAEIVDDATAKDAAYVAADAADAAYVAADDDAADAAYAAARAARAARAAHATSATSAFYSGSSAEAAASAADDPAATEQIISQCVDIIERMIAMSL